jgi:hypothetical protein
VRPEDLLKLIEVKLTKNPEVPVSYELRCDHGLEDDDAFLAWCEENRLAVQPPILTGLSYIIHRSR